MTDKALMTRAAPGAQDEPDEVRGALEELATAARERFGAIDDLRAEMRDLRDDLATKRAAALVGGGAGAPATETRALSQFADMLRGRVDTREMNGVVGPSGGFAVPTELDRIVADMAVDLNPLRRVAQVVQTSSSSYQKLVNARGATSGWAAERDTREETDTPSFRAIEPPGGELFALAVTSNEFLEDSIFDAGQFLENNILTEFAAQEGTAFVVGDGNKKPLGFVGPVDTPHATSAAADGSRDFGVLQHVPTGNTSGLDSTDPADSLFSLVTALRPAYRQGPGVAWVMNSRMAGFIRRLKDVDGRFLWQPSLQAGQPNLLLGYPIIEAEAMPDMEAGKTPIAFGNFNRGYLITDRRGMIVIPDRVTRPGFTRFYMSKRVGGKVLDSNAIKLLRISDS